MIAKAASKLLGPMAMDLLKTPIRKDVWESIKTEFGMNDSNCGGLKQETYLDLILLGSYLEDKSAVQTEISEPKITDALVAKVMSSEGPVTSQHWMEHFWNDDLIKEKGLVLDIDYICDIIAEALGGKFWGEFFAEIRSEIYEIIAAPITMMCKDGSTVLDKFRSAPARAQEYWDLLIKQYKDGQKERAYLNLGRVCHLLADVGTPAHMHGDGHIGVYPVAKLLEYIGLDGLIDTNTGEGVDDDQYEYYTGYIIEENLKELAKQNSCEYEDALPLRWNVVSGDVASYKPDWEMFDYFKELGTMTRKFDSDDVDGTENCQPFHWEHFKPWDLYTYKLERQWDGDLRNSACNDIAERLIPATISYTAGLIMHFFDVVDEKTEANEPGRAIVSVKATKMHVLDDTDPCGSGEIYLTADVNNRDQKLTGRINANTGDTVNLTGYNLFWDAIYVAANTNIDLNITSHAQDNDDWYFLWQKIRDSESLGRINYTINTKDIPDNGHYYTTLSSQSPHYYDLDIDIYKDVLMKRKVTRVNDEWKRKFGNRKSFISEKLHWHYSDSGSPVTLYLNFQDSTLHMRNKNHEPCGHFKRASAINGVGKIELRLNKKEMFESDIDNLFDIDSNRSFKQASMGSLNALKKLAEKKKRTKLKDVISKIEESERYRILYKEEGTLINRIIRVKCPEFVENHGEITEDNFGELFKTTCRCCSDERRFW